MLEEALSAPRRFVQLAGFQEMGFAHAARECVRAWLEEELWGIAPLGQSFATQTNYAREGFCAVRRPSNTQP
jgi:hypothetical protein